MTLMERRAALLARAEAYVRLLIQGESTPSIAAMEGLTSQRIQQMVSHPGLPDWAKRWRAAKKQVREESTSTMSITRINRRLFEQHGELWCRRGKHTVPLSECHKRKGGEIGVPCKRCIAASTRAHRAAHKIPARPRKRQPVELVARKKSVRMVLHAAVVSGLVEKPTDCRMCKRKLPLHGHHKDYSKPLDVEWLCSRCHGATHRGRIFGFSEDGLLDGSLRQDEDNQSEN